MIDDCDETYVNGRRVGGLCGWDTPRRYALPAGLLKPGKNMLAVRVTDTGGGGGFHGERSAMRLQWGADSIALAGSWKARMEKLMDKGQPGPNDLPMLSFNAMVSPLTDFPIRGVIWYQGESNVPRAAQYVQTFPLLIADWRAQWQQLRLPFYFVQLASFLSLEKNTLAGSPWAELRDAQRQTAKLAGTGMVVATDVGNANDIHPRNKQAIGLRLALQALKGEYGKMNIVANGPIYRALRLHGSQLELSFSELGGGLVAAGSDGVLRGFTVADDGRQFQPAQARIQGNKVIVSHPDMSHPVAVRYGWVDNPEQSNLFNRNGLPASPFRTDDWPWLTDGVKYRY
jgi:sialate O-acetylesterase